MFASTSTQINNTTKMDSAFDRANALVMLLKVHIKFMAIRAAIRRQFEAIRDVFRQFGMFEVLGTRDSRQFGPRVLCLL